MALGLAAALLALCMRLMVPTGWMPVAAADGVMFTLCSGSGEQRTVFVAFDKPSTTDMADDHNGVCAFSGIGTPALPDASPSISLQIILLAAVLAMAATPNLHTSAKSRLRPPLRGPPARA